MIDTDKYKGHTEGPWILGSNTEKNSNGHRTSYGTDERPIIYSDVAIKTNYEGQELSVKIGQVNRQDAQLIADAPLLLAEVKRLRKENDVLAEAIKEDNEILKKHIETLAELKQLRKLRKQLEDSKRQIQFTADWIRDRGEDTHAKELDEFLEWME